MLEENENPKWEYEKLVGTLSETYHKFAALGEQGWELTIETTERLLEPIGITRVFIFKRKKQ